MAIIDSATIITDTGGENVRTEAFMYAGTWVADCGLRHVSCYGSEPLTFRQDSVRCRECGQVAQVSWPPNAEEIREVLSARPIPQTRNWAPPLHRQSVGSGYPEGQTPNDLRIENVAHGVGI